MQKTLRIDLEKREALEKLKSLALLGFGATMLLNVKDNSFKEEYAFENTQYLGLNLNAFYIPNILLSLLKLERKDNNAFYVNVLINSNTLYKSPFLKYALKQQENENTIYSLENDRTLNSTFNTLNSLKQALEQKNFYLNFLDLDDKNSLLSFYTLLLEDENLKQYFYLKNDRFYTDEKRAYEIKTSAMNSSYSSLELYLKLLNDFERLSKFELIKILDILAQNNIKALYVIQDFKKERKNEAYIFTKVLLNLRMK